MLENKIEFNQEICCAAINTFCDDDLDLMGPQYTSSFAAHDKSLVSKVRKQLLAEFYE